MSNHQLNECTREEFYRLEGIRRIIEVEDVFARRYAFLKVNNFAFGISWASDLVEPYITDLSTRWDLLIIGIDQNVVAISPSKGSVQFRIGLFDFFSFTVITENAFAIVSETSITLISCRKCSISRVISLPDIISECTVEGEKFIVETLSGEKYVFA